MNVTILFLWTVVAHANPYHRPQADWRALSEFTSPAACVKAAQTLGIEDNRYRCVPKSLDSAGGGK